jgi:integrase
MGKRPSLTRQVELILSEMNRTTAPAEPSRSRHAAKAAGQAHQGIFSHNTYRSIQQRVNTLLGNLPPELRPKLLGDLSPEAMRWSVAAMRERELKGVTIRSTLSAMRKLAIGMQAKGWCKLRPNELVPDDLYTGLTPSAPRGGYSISQVEQISSRVRLDPRDGPEFERMIRLLVASGLRHNELARLREDDLDRVAGVIRVRSSNAKGGRERFVMPDDPGRTELKHALATIPAGRHWLWTDGPILTRRLQDAIRKACDELAIAPKGLHGLRATFAEAFLHRRMATGLSEHQARRELTQLLGHNRIQVTYRYVPQLA